MANEPLTIKDWQLAVADSQNEGFSLMRNVDIESYPGSVKTGKKPQTMFHTAYASTFTADASTDICTASATVPNTATAVVLTTTGTLPAGLSLATTYFIIKLSSTTFKLATTIANANASTAINITDAGSGTHTVTTRNPGTINHFVIDTRTGLLFAQDSNARVWYQSSNTFLLLNGNTLTNGSGNGIVILRTSDGAATYLFAFRNASVDVVNVFGTSEKENPTWSNSWQSLNTSAGTANSHFALRGQDGIIYFCDDRYIGTIRENAASVFDPGNAATYTYNNQALDLPGGLLTYWIEELGTNILISVSNDDKIYPWDRISDSFNLPIPVGEYSGNKMKNIGNIVYILAGGQGNIYTTQGSYCRLYKKIPIYLVNNGGSILANPLTWGGIAARNGNLLVGVGTTTSGNSGVYQFYPDGRFIQDNVPTTGSSRVTALYSQSDFYTMGYSGGADNFDNAELYSSYEAVIQSALYRVATKTLKTSYHEVEVQLARPVAGHVRVSYRTNTTDAFTTIATFSTTSAASSYDTDIGLTDIENIQIQVEMDGSAEVLEVRLRS